MLPNECFALACRAYYDETGLIVDKRNGEFAHCPLPERYGDKGYYLLWEHHQQQGLLQSKDIGECCFFLGHAKQWLLNCEIFPDNYFELWDLYEEYATKLGRLAGTAAASKHTSEEKSKSAKETWDSYSLEEREARVKKVAKDSLLSSTPEERSERARRGKAKQLELYGPNRVKPLKIIDSQGAVTLFPSITAAAASLGCSEYYISNYLKGKRVKKLVGYIIERLDK